MIRPFRPASKYVQNTWHQQLNVLEQNSIPLSLINWFVSFHGASHCLIITCTWHILSQADLCVCIKSHDVHIFCMRVSIQFNYAGDGTFPWASFSLRLDKLTGNSTVLKMMYNKLRDVISFECSLTELNVVNGRDFRLREHSQIT